MAGSDARSDTQRDGPSGWLVALLSLVLLAGGAAVYWWLSRDVGAEAAQPAPPPIVRAATAEAASAVSLFQTGFVRPVLEVDITPEIVARIASLGDGFRVGARVARGEVLVELERSRVAADLEDAEAGVAQARAALTEAEIAESRQRELAEEDFTSEARLQDAVLAVARAEADLASARAVRTRALRAVQDATIAAPFDGVVTARSAAPGQAVSPGVVLGRLVATEAGEVRLGLTAGDLALLGGAEAALGTEVEILAVDGPSGTRLGSGRVSDVDPRIQPGSRTTALVVRIEGAFAERTPRPLRVDELVRLVLPVDLPQADAVAVPEEAVKAGGTVWEIADGRLARRDVRVLHREAGLAYVVADGLSDGDRVMLSDRGGALDGTEVRVAADAEAQPGAPVSEGDGASGGAPTSGGGAAGAGTGRDG